MLMYPCPIIQNAKISKKEVVVLLQNNMIFSLISSHPWLAFYVSTHLTIWFQKVTKPVLYLSSRVSSEGDQGNQGDANNVNKTITSSPLVHNIVNSCPTLHNYYYPALVFFNGHLQLIPLMIISYFYANYFHYKWITEAAEMADGEV